jgi:MYXO-CTERM domain-containing protein
MHKLVSVFAFATSLTVPLVIPNVARAAGLEACGNISIEANATCNAIATGGCTVECQKLSFEAACYAKGYTQCSGQCSASATAECTGSCDLSKCEAKCNVDPGSFDCSANCVAGCDASCSGTCQGKCGTDSSCMTKCQGSCKATCQGECSASCSGTPPTADCQARCQASCSGQCSARANVDCQASCESNYQANCVATLQGGCVTQCESPQGAIECNGQYVDDGGNGQACLDAIQNWLASINFSATGSATASCQGNQCSAEAQGEASCNCGVPGGRSTLPSALAALSVAGIALLRRRRRT